MNRYERNYNQIKKKKFDDMAWMIDGGPEGYQEGSGLVPSILPSEKSVFKQNTERPEPMKQINTSEKKSADFSPMNPGDFPDASHFQAISFNVLRDKMEIEAKIGNSMLLLDSYLYKIGNGMKDFLIEKGFDIGYSNTTKSNYTVISW